jgi:ABC-type branched-subunit amino acid transport system substrate-binding protein
MSLRLSRRAALKRTGALAATAAVGGAVVHAPAIAQNPPIRIGSVATLEGPFATGGQDGYRAMEMLFQAENMTIGGRRIEWIRESSNAQADVALARARKLIEQDNVDFIIGPLSGAEGIALKDYSATLTGKTIINGSSGAADTTLRNPSRNFFRFNTDGTQWMAGLGTYVRRTLNVSEVTIVAGDYAFPYAQVFGFSLEFCRLGGKANYLWSPLGTTDFASQIAQIPRSTGALVVVHGGTDGLAFMTQYAQAGGNLPIIGGSELDRLRGPLPAHAWRVPVPVDPRGQLRHQHDGGDPGAQAGQWRPVGQPGRVPARARRAEVQGADRGRRVARPQPPGDLGHLPDPDRGAQQPADDRRLPARHADQPDARRSRGAVPGAGRAVAQQHRLHRGVLRPARARGWRGPADRSSPNPATT